MTNPWNLTPRQCEAMAALVEHGSDKAVARALNLVHKRGCNLMRECCRRMGARSRVQAALTWDRWMRAQESQA